MAGRNNRNRYYDYYTGRWLQRDPLGYVDGMNSYEYVLCNPLKLVDPKGLSECDASCEDKNEKKSRFDRCKLGERDYAIMDVSVHIVGQDPASKRALRVVQLMLDAGTVFDICKKPVALPWDYLNSKLFKAFKKKYEEIGESLGWELELKIQEKECKRCGFFCKRNDWKKGRKYWYQCTIGTIIGRYDDLIDALNNMDGCIAEFDEKFDYDKGE